MPTETSAKQYNYQDYLQLDDDNRYELIGGKLILVPTPYIVRQRISQRLITLIGYYIDCNELGELLVAPTDVLLSDTDKPQPDIRILPRNV